MDRKASTDQNTLMSERDAEALRRMARDMEELTLGVHKLAEQALLALAQGDWRGAVQDLEKLRTIT